MTSEKDLREQLAACTRIFAMQGMIGLFGHVSVYQPETKRVLITPGMGSDKGSLRPEDMVPTDLDGKPLEGQEGPPVATGHRGRDYSAGDEKFDGFSSQTGLRQEAFLFECRFNDGRLIR